MGACLVKEQVMTYDVSIIWIRDRFVVQVRSPQTDLCGAIRRLDALQVTKVAFIRRQYVRKLEEI